MGVYLTEYNCISHTLLCNKPNHCDAIKWRMYYIVFIMFYCFYVLTFFGHSCKVNSINLAHSVHRPLLVEEYLRNTIFSGSSYFTDPFILINIQFAHTRITNWPKFRMPNWEFCKSEMTRKGGLRDEYNDRNRTKYEKCKMGL